MKKVEIKCTGSDYASVDDFHPLQGGLKVLNDENYQKLRYQILTYGFSEPVAAWENDNKKFIISGHQRIATLKRMVDEGYQVPFIPYVMVQAENEHEAKMKVLSMASQYGVVSSDGLKIFMEDMDIEIADLEQNFALPGIDLPALARDDEDEGTQVRVSAHTRTIGISDEDVEAAKAAVQTESRVKRGELWNLGEHRLLCGDATSIVDLEKLMAGVKAEMMFTDPPYGINYEGGHFHSGDVNVTRKREKLAGDMDAAIYTQFMPLVPKVVDGPCYTWFAFAKCRQAVEAVEAVGELHALIIWHKTNATYAAMNAQYKQRHEPCMYWKPKGSTLRWAGPTDEHTVWEMKRDARNDLHPTQKPVALAERAIGNHDVTSVLDLFAGSGSTLIAAENQNKKCYAMEISEQYCTVIIDRWEKLTGKKAVLGK